MHSIVHCVDSSITLHRVSGWATGTAEHMATEVRRRRQQRNWTLDGAAARLGVSRRLLAQIEAGQANPSLSTLLSVAAGFDVSLVELLAGQDRPAITVQADKASAPVLWTGEFGGEGRLLVGADPLELWDWCLQPGDERRAVAHRPNSREALLVTAGVVTLSVGAVELVSLRQGQSAMFCADEPHSYRNETSQLARFVLAVHEPSGGSA